MVATPTLDPEAKLERPKRTGQGDYATNAAMLLAPALGSAPREIAGRLGEELNSRLEPTLTGYEVAGPGFLNLVLSDDWHRDALRVVLSGGEGFSAGGALRPERILLEFVSANPTAVLVAASGRHAAYGDSLARILLHHGHTVWREYYFNDAGSQIRRLGESVRARALGQEPPEDGYQGAYVADLAAQIEGAADESVDVDVIARRAVEMLLENIKATLVRFGVTFDRFFSERTLHQGSPSALDRAIEQVRDAGHVYEHDGAVWLRTTTFGDDKDRVLMRSRWRADLFRSGCGLHARQARSRLRTPAAPCRCRPPRLRRTAEGRVPGARQRPRPAGGRRSSSSCTCWRATPVPRCPSAAASL